MLITPGFAGRTLAIVDLIRTTFTAAEGAAEGALIGGLIGDLMALTPPADLHLFCTEEAGEVIAAVAFSRLHYPEDPHRVALLAPMAVAPGWQRQGVGQALIRAGLGAIRAQGYEVALTYGDPAYYKRFGFQPVSADHARPPLPLTMPHGWQGQALNGGPMPRLSGPSFCVAALDRADLW